MSTSMTMDKFTVDLKEHARSVGADLIGIAGIERFKEIGAEHHPLSIFPEAKSVVVVGKRIVRGALRGIEEGTQFANYSLYGYRWLENRFLAMVTLKVSEELERNGWEAVPIMDLPIQTPPMGVSVREDNPAPNVMVDIRDAAVRAGLGEIGYLDVFLSPEFGPRQRFQAIFTNAELVEDPLFEGKICDRSAEMNSFCPLGAVGGEKEKTVEICGKEARVAEIDYSKCRECRNGAVANRYHESGLPDRLGAVCVRSLVDYLENKGRVGNKFNNPFRKKVPWHVVGSVDIFDENQDIE